MHKHRRGPEPAGSWRLRSSSQASIGHVAQTAFTVVHEAFQHVNTETDPITSPKLESLDPEIFKIESLSYELSTTSLLFLMCATQAD